MYLPEDDFYVVLEIKTDAVNQSQPMNLDECTKWLYDKLKEQPLQYFNENKRFKIIHLKTAIIKDIRMKIDLT